MRQSLSPKSFFNLFSNGERTISPPHDPKPQKHKKEIQIVFHHPHLLYLSSQKEKSRCEISREIQQKIMKRIQRSNKDLTEYKSEGCRPHTTDGLQRKYNNLVTDSENRCRTAQVGKINKKIRNSKPNLEVLGNSSTFSGPFFQRTNIHNQQRKSTTKTQAMSVKTSQSYRKKAPTALQILQSSSPSDKLQMWQRMLTINEHKSAVRLNMCLDIQKKYLKFNTKKIKTAERSKQSQTYFAQK